MVSLNSLEMAFWDSIAGKYRLIKKPRGLVFFFYMDYICSEGLSCKLMWNILTYSKYSLWSTIGRPRDYILTGESPTYNVVKINT